MLFLWSQNLGETAAGQVIVALAVVLAGAAILTALAGLVLRDRLRGALVATPIVLGFLMYGHTANLVRGFLVPGAVQQAACLGLVALAIVAAIRLDERRLRRLDTILLRISAILVAVTLVFIVPFLVTSATARSADARPEPVATTTSAKKRDVYWLIFDRYGSDRALELQYGFKNDLSTWLKAHGFTVLADSHANYIRTVLSMASTLQMAPIDQLAKAVGPDSSDLGPVNAWLQDPLVARQFKALGYRYEHVGSWWDPTRTDAGADVELTAASIPGTGDFADALYDVTAVPAIARRLGIPMQSKRDRQYRYSRAGLDALASLRDAPGPKFVTAHVLLPHPPLVFDRDGSFIDDATADGMTDDELYRRQLDYTNTRLKAILSDLLSLPEDRRPIIIFQADEGPWPPTYGTGRKGSDWAARATDRELEQKYGIMNAWFLPDGEDLGLSPTTTAINTFPALFSRYFGIDYPLLPDRAYSSRDWYHPYDLTDITDRLPSLR